MVWIVQSLLDIPRTAGENWDDITGALLNNANHRIFLKSPDYIKIADGYVGMEGEGLLDKLGSLDRRGDFVLYNHNGMGNYFLE
jgi:hypothetical protein